MTARNANAKNETSAVISPKDLATLLETDPKTIRKFLRSIISEDNRPGKGSRWVLTSDLVPALTDRFNDWKTNRAKVVTMDMITPPDAK